MRAGRCGSSDTGAVRLEQFDTPEPKSTTAEATYRPDEFAENSGSVTREVTSACQQSVNDVYVVAVCTNAAVEVIGGAEDCTNVPFGETVPVEVPSVATRETPPACDLYATLDGASLAVE